MKSLRQTQFEIVNPKRHLDKQEKLETKLFPYYAGYSASFAEQLLSSMSLAPGSTVLDPWNGSGTTTLASFKLGFKAVGIDLNPVMTLVAKASFVSIMDLDSLLPLAHSLAYTARSQRLTHIELDPLDRWFASETSLTIRKLEEAINRSLIDFQDYVYLQSGEGLNRATPLAAFYYLCLFRVVRRLAESFIASNPTWIRAAKTANERLSVTEKAIMKLFVAEVQLLSKHTQGFQNITEADAERLELYLANTENLPLSDGSIDAVITSPPYCTRIDYAVSTYIELAILRVGKEDFSKLRRALTGSSTVKKEATSVNPLWGASCANFLESLYAHPSKASKTYYFKSHVQYFDSLFRSVKEVSRVLAPGAISVFVVQNSYYKELRNDIAEVTTEMAGRCSLRLVQRADFNAKRTMADLHKHAKKYVEKKSTVESVLCFVKA